MDHVTRGGRERSLLVGAETRALCQMLWSLQKACHPQAKGTASSHSHTMGLRQGKPLIYHNVVRIVGIRPIAETEICHFL